MANLTAFINQYLGMPNTGDTQENRGQCVGLVELWLKENGKVHIWGDAKDLLANASAAHIPVMRNTPTNVPVSGAVIVWNGTWGQGHGHTAIVVAANVTHVVVFEQNNPLGMPPLVATHGYGGIDGWIML